jgi:hypothetical protein
MEEHGGARRRGQRLGKLAVGRRQKAVGCWLLAVGSWQLERGSW